ncbi:STAS domain-containing protein [Amycolatopsis eburnea]|uniref:STAS domain-containing protein n=2 Tax=Amycolatopsis eburnea TaxID=2267691 RepID=A0A3R9F4M1_9PSEU|nr:STAS domain-containing protein [Amycolatopsis eburnea]
MTLAASGPLDAAAAGRLEAASDAVVRHAAEGVGAVVVDLTAVTHLTLEALKPLVSLARACRTAGLEVHVVPSPTARKKIELTGLAEVLQQTS